MSGVMAILRRGNHLRAVGADAHPGVSCVRATGTVERRGASDAYRCAKPHSEQIAASEQTLKMSLEHLSIASASIEECPACGIQPSEILPSIHKS